MDPQHASAYEVAAFLRRDVRTGSDRSKRRCDFHVPVDPITRQTGVRPRARAAPFLGNSNSVAADGASCGACSSAIILGPILKSCLDPLVAAAVACSDTPNVVAKALEAVAIEERIPLRSPTRSWD